MLSDRVVIYSKLLVMLLAGSALSGCINDDGALAAQGEHTKAARIEYAAKSFANYALMNARGRADIAPGSVVEASGDVRAASMVCPLYDGTRNARCGRMEAQAWQTADMAGCAAASTVAMTVDDAIPAAHWETTDETEIDIALAAAAPARCKRAVVRHDKGGASVSEKTIETCDAADLAPRMEVPEPVGFHERPVQIVTLPDPPVACPPASIVLPTYSTRAEYYDALAPYAAQLPLPEGCSQTVTATAHWPFYQTFIVQDARAGHAGERHLTVRLYKIALSLSWHADGGEESYTGSHEMPPIGGSNQPRVSSLAAYPDAFKTMCGTCTLIARLTNTAGGRAATYRFNGNLHARFVGDHTTAFSSSRFPYVYMNPGAEPWGNTAEQEAHARQVGSLTPGGNFDERGSGPIGY